MKMVTSTFGNKRLSIEIKILDYMFTFIIYVLYLIVEFRVKSKERVDHGVIN